MSLTTAADDSIKIIAATNTWHQMTFKKTASLECKENNINLEGDTIHILSYI